jgi:hypothetical protein
MAKLTAISIDYLISTERNEVSNKFKNSKKMNIQLLNKFKPLGLEEKTICVHFLKCEIK